MAVKQSKGKRAKHGRQALAFLGVFYLSIVFFATQRLLRLRLFIAELLRKARSKNAFGERSRVRRYASCFFSFLFSI
jgi:hypothetical protein